MVVEASARPGGSRYRCKFFFSFHFWFLILLHLLWLLLLIRHNGLAKKNFNNELFCGRVFYALHKWMKRRRYRYENNKYGEDNGFNAFSRKVWAQYDDDTPHNVSYSRVNKEKLLHFSFSFFSSLSAIIVFVFFPRCNFQCTHSVRHKEGPFFCSQFQLLKLSLSLSLSIIVRHYTTITASLPPFIST